MSEDTCDDISFRDYYKAENSDDEENNNDLETRLYADIYYPSNNEIELGADITSNAVPLSSIMNESINRQENIQNNLNNKVISEYEVTREQEEAATEELIQTNKNNLANQEINNAVTEVQKKNKKTPSKKHKSSKQSKNKRRERSQKKNIALVDESNMDTKYNVLQKQMKREIDLSNVQEETLEDSDLESIFEVPVPPKPKPLLINLQDSDDEDTGSSIDEDDLLEGRLYDKNVPKSNSKVSDMGALSSPEVEIIEMSFDHQDTAAESNNAHKPPRDKNTSATTNDKSTRAHEVHEDIVLNCTMIQKGARDINEIKRLSKSTKQNKIETSVDGTSSKKKQLQNASTGNNSANVCTSQELYPVSQGRQLETEKQTKKMRQQINETNVLQTDETNETNENGNTCRTLIHDLRHAVQTLENTLLEVSCSANNNLVMSQKRHNEDNSEEGREDGDAESNSPVRKRQCTFLEQECARLTLPPPPQYNRDALFCNFFEPLPEEVRKFYNDSRGQENFDICDVQRDMSKDPKKWIILDEDLMPSPATKRGRYWSDLRCTYCQRNGHLRKDCPEPRKVRCCHMCGQQGHVTWRCPQQVCLTCGKKQTSYRKSCEYCRTLFCTICYSMGHKKSNCPDLWRRYHSITQEIRGAPAHPGNVMKPASQLHCCNCSKRGHESFTCTELRWSTHFITPPFVTSYTSGPVYESQNSTKKISTNTETSTRLLRRSFRILNQQTHENTPVTEAQPTPPPPNVDTSSSSATAETNEETCAQIAQEKVTTISKVTVLKFVNILYCCGNFRDKNNHHARVLVSNLSRHDKLCPEGKTFLKHKFSNNTVLPLFLKKLRKVVEFEMMIGPLAGNLDVMVQLMAPKDCVNLLFHLLLYWLNLPLTEKKHGLDVNLPIHVGEMRNFLTKLDLPRKMLEDVKQPAQLLQQMQATQKNLCKMPQSKAYFHKQTCMWDMQKKLLIFINTRPEQSVYFRKILSYTETLKRQPGGDQLDAATYLDILLSYNNICTPHTPPSIRKILKSIRTQLKTKVREQQLAANVDLSIPLATSSSCMPQETDTIENPFAVTNVQNVPDDESDIIEIEDICQPGTSDAVENFNEMQHLQNILPLDDEPVSIQLENSRGEVDQQSTDNQQDSRPDNANVNINLPVTEPDISITDAGNQSNDQPALVQTKRIKRTKYSKVKMFQQEARNLANQARAFQLPYMVKVAEDILKKLNNKTLKHKDLQKVRKMMKMEQKHQKLIKNFYGHLN